MTGVLGINNNLPLDKAEIIAFFLEAFLYGVSMTLFIITLWVLIYHKRGGLNKHLLLICGSMAVFGALHMAIDISRILEGFINSHNQPGGPVAYFSKLYVWSHVLKTAIFAAQTVIADLFATYRCWIVWEHSWVAIIPALLVIATSVTGVGIVHGCAVLEDGENVFDRILLGWITSFFSLTLATNLVCTSLIAIRIWYVTRKASYFPNESRLMSMVSIIIESGGIYSISCITLLILYLLGSNAQYPALDGTFAVISIAFNLIIIRIALGIAHPTNQNQNITHTRHSYASHIGNQYPLQASYRHPSGSSAALENQSEGEIFRVQ